MICSGKKKEEYRADIQHWRSRLFYPDGKDKEFDCIEFRNGYQPTSPKAKFKFKGIEYKYPNSEWCPDEFVNTQF